MAESNDNWTSRIAARFPQLAPWVLDMLANAVGTILAAAVIFSATVAFGLLDDVSVQLLIGPLVAVLVAAFAAAYAVRVGRATWDAARELLTEDREALADVADAISEVQGPRLSDEQLEALGELGGRLRGSDFRLSDEQLSDLRKAARVAGGLSLSPAERERLNAAFKLSDEQQKALRVLGQNALSPEQRRKLAELGRQLRKATNL